MKDNPVAKNAHKFNKSQVMKDRKKAEKKGYRKHKGKVDEKLSAKDDAGEWVKDFRKSDAPQFKGKSDKKKQQMAIAAYLDAKDDAKKESALPPHLRKILDKKGNIKKGKVKIKGRSSSSKSKVTDVNVPGYTSRESVEEWACNQTETSRRVKGGDKRKKYMKEKQVKEEKKGLWDRIHAKRKRGEKPAKPGEKGYPKTLDVGEGLKQARKNVGSDSCWDGYKATGTKMKNGKEVPDCKKEGVDEAVKVGDKVKFKKGIDPKIARGYQSALNKSGKVVKDYGDGDVKVNFGGNDDRSVDAKLLVKESAQDRLSARAAKHGLGKPNKAADDYISKMMKKYGAKDMADLKKKMGMKEGISENFRTLATKGMGAEKKSDIKVGRFVDYYDSKDGDKHSGEIVKMGPRNYQVKDEITNKIHTFNYYDPAKARKLMKESVINELTQRELDMMADRKKKNLVKRGKAKAEPKADRTYVSNRKGDDDHIVMQLRKAQDVKGNMDIKVTPTGKTVKLPIKMIDKLLATHDKLQKPDDKRKFRIMVTKELRKRAK